MNEQLTPEELRIELAKCLDEANQRLTVRLRDYVRDYARDAPKSPAADLICKTLDNIIATFPNKKPPEGGESKGTDEWEEFERVCRPAVEFLQKRYHPHAHIIIDWDRATLVKDLKGLPFKVPD